MRALNEIADKTETLNYLVIMRLLLCCLTTTEDEHYKTGSCSVLLSYFNIYFKLNPDGKMSGFSLSKVFQ